MWTPSRAALALAMGVFGASGVGIAGATAADAAPHHHVKSASFKHAFTHVITMSVPGTGVQVTSDVDEDGNVTSTSAGDDEGDEVGVNDQGDVELGDANDAAEADDQGDNADDQGENADDQGDDNNNQDEATSANQSSDDNQGDDNQGDDQGDVSGDQNDNQGGDGVSGTDSGSNNSGDDQGDDGGTSGDNGGSGGDGGGDD